MRCLDEGDLTTIGGGHLDEEDARGAAVAAGATLTGGAVGCLAGGFLGPVGGLVGCGVGAALGLSCGVVHHFITTHN